MDAGPRARGLRRPFALRAAIGHVVLLVLLVAACGGSSPSDRSPVITHAEGLISIQGTQDRADVTVTVWVNPGRGADTHEAIYVQAARQATAYAAAVKKDLLLRVTLLEATTAERFIESRSFSITADGLPIAAVTIPGQEAAGESEEFAQAAWGTGEGEVSLGQTDFGAGGPGLMAVSPNGETVAVLDYLTTRMV